jgi:hypothetical protein
MHFYAKKGVTEIWFKLSFSELNWENNTKNLAIQMRNRRLAIGPEWEWDKFWAELTLTMFTDIALLASQNIQLLNKVYYHQLWNCMNKRKTPAMYLVLTIQDSKTISTILLLRLLFMPIKLNGLLVTMIFSLSIIELKVKSWF